MAYGILQRAVGPWQDNKDNSTSVKKMNFLEAVFRWGLAPPREYTQHVPLCCFLGSSGTRWDSEVLVRCGKMT